MKGALLIGIDHYPKDFKLNGCGRDADKLAKLLRYNDDADSSQNFDVDIRRNIKERTQLRSSLISFFKKEHLNTALFYFSGHGYICDRGGFIVTPDFRHYDEGVSMDEILSIANHSKIKNKIIIIDSCYAGAIGCPDIMGGLVFPIGEGVTIMTACSKNEPAYMTKNGSVFTILLQEALKGGAADIMGNVTIGNIYAFIDRSLGVKSQRPQFKSNVSGFYPLRTVKPRLPLEVLKKLILYFPDPGKRYSLNPSYEDTNCPSKLPSLKKPHANPKNVTILSNLQRMVREGLVVPDGADHMYFAAMNSKACRLTPLGKHYWDLVMRGRL